MGTNKIKHRAFFKYVTLIINGTVCSDDIEEYSKAYTESKKIPGAKEGPSPTEVQETKKRKNVIAFRNELNGTPPEIELEIDIRVHEICKNKDKRSGPR